MKYLGGGMMSETKHVYVAIDLKSFYASVECQERNLNPLTTNLVVADPSRTEKTICLAVSPTLKSYGIGGRARLFEVIQKVKVINSQRKAQCKQFVGSSNNDLELKQNQKLALDYIIAPPRMALYLEYSTKIYDLYLRFVAPEDIHVYSIDEVFIDLTKYLKVYHLSAKELAKKMIDEIYQETGIVATAGIATNLYLCKVAMDIVAKHIEPDKNGVRIVCLNEKMYRQLLWNHRPLTDFWRVGRGYAKKLEAHGLYTMGDIARCSIGKEDEYYNEELLYRLFGINAELLIDHAWGYEPTTIKDIKAYKPVNNSLGTGQVLGCAYDYQKAKLIIKEMLDSLTLSLVEKRLVTNQIVLDISYDKESLKNSKYHGEVTIDRYGRKVPKHGHGTANLDNYSASTKIITEAVLKLYERIVNKNLKIKKINISANHIIDEASLETQETFEQLDLFTDYEQLKKQREQEAIALQKERKLQEATLAIKKKYGKNALLKGMDLEEGAKTVERNGQIGGHKA